MVTKHAVLLGAQARDRRTTGEVEPVRTKLDRDAVERFERVFEQQKLGLRIDAGALRGAAVPRVANFQSTIARVHIEVARRADDARVALAAYDEGHCSGFLAHLERSVHIAEHCIRRADRRVPEVPQLSVTRRLQQFGAVTALQRLQHNPVAPGQGDWRDEGHRSGHSVSGCAAA